MRGVAVLAVVVFHAFPSFIAQGFLGVDVFFVISGFLITGIILKGLEANEFSFWNFYKRRALRLLPANLVTLLVTTALAFIFLTNSQMVDYAEQLIGSLAFVANFVLANQTGYFEGAAGNKPLLHIWSLALEEQFYFVAPLMLWLTPLRARPWLLGIAFILSLGLCLVLVTDLFNLPIPSKTAGKIAFFMLPARAWELLVGSLCAWMMLRHPQFRVSAWLKYLALLVIPVVCVVGLDPVHPRIDAMIVVAATAVILCGNSEWLPETALARPIGLVGNWSYSLYLIHWPLFSFAFIVYQRHPPTQVLAGLAALSVLLAWLQYKYIEQPFRKKWPIRMFKAPIVLGGTMAALIAVIIPTMDAESPYTDALRPNVGLSPSCAVKSRTWTDQPVCRTSDAPRVAVWGDSYAMHLIAGLEGIPLVQMTKPACSPIEGVARVSARYNKSWAQACVAFNESALSAIVAMPSVHYVIMSSPFTQVMVERKQRLLVGDRVEPFSDAGSEALMQALIRLKAAGKTPIIVGPTPHASFNAGTCNERMIEGLPIMGRSGCSIAIADALHAGGGIDALLEHIGEKAGVDVLLPASVLCTTDRCITSKQGVILYVDEGHLTRAGSRLVMKKLAIKDMVSE